LVGPRVYVALAALLFSTGGTAIKMSSLSSLQIAGLRSAVAAAVLVALVPSWRRVDGRSLLVGAAFATTMILFVTANTLTTAANAIFLQTTSPLYVLVLGPPLLRERPRRADLPVAVMIGTGALLFFVWADTPLASAPNPVAGNLAAAASGLTWALTVVGLRWLRRGKSRISDAAGSAVMMGNTLAFLICAPFAWPLASASATDWAIVLYLGVFQIGLAYVCLVRGVRGAPALDVALLLVLEPVWGTLLAWAVHGEMLGAWAAIGAFIILLGLVVQSAETVRVD